MAQKTISGKGRPNSKLREILTAVGDTMWSWKRGATGNVQVLPIDDIIKRHGLKEYKRVRVDDQVKAALSFKKILTYGRSFDMDPADDSDEAKEIAEFVTWSLGRINIKSILREALTALDFGFSIGEVLFELVEKDGRTVIGLKDVKFRDPEPFQIVTDQHGNIQKFEQRTVWGKVIPVSPDKVFHFVHNKEFQNHYGSSDLRSIYKNWWAKKYLINFWNVHLERFGSPMTAIKYPQGASAEMKTSLKAILSGLQSKTEILIPQGVEIDILEGSKTGTGDFKSALEYHDGGIARGILVPALLGFGAPTGPGGEGQDRLQLRTLFKVTQQLGDDLSFEFMRQVIWQLIDLNFDHKGLYPKWMWADYGEFEASEIADSIRLLHNAGVIDMDQEDVNYARGVVGLPIRDEDDPDEVLRPNPAPQGANMPPPPAEQGNARGDKQTKGDSNGN